MGWSLLIMAGLLPLLCGSVTARADDDAMTLQAQLRQKATYSSNPLMLSSGAEVLWGETTSPQLTFKALTPTAQILVDARVDQSFFNQARFNSTDLTLSGNHFFRTQRWFLGIDKRLDYDTTRTSETTSYGTQSVVARHLGFSLAPRVTFSPSAVDTVSLAAAYAKSMYQSTAFTNFETFSVTPSYTRQFDPLNAGVFSLQVRRYQTTRNNATRVDSANASLGWNREFSPTLKGDFAVGLQTSREYAFGVAQGAWTLHTTFSGGLTFDGEQDRLNLSASRAQSGYGNGTDVLETVFSLAETHKLTPVIALNFDAKYLISQKQRAVAGDRESLADGRAGISYNLMEDLDLVANYRYRYETLKASTKTVQDNSVMIGLTFRSSPWVLGR